MTDKSGLPGMETPKSPLAQCCQLAQYWPDIRGRLNILPISPAPSPLDATTRLSPARCKLTAHLFWVAASKLLSVTDKFWNTSSPITSSHCFPYSRKSIHSLLKKTKTNKQNPRGFPGGAVVENLPANAGDTGSRPGLGRSHMPWSN